MIFGSSAAGSNALELAADTAYVSKFRLAEQGTLVKLTAPMDGLGSGRGAQSVRAVAYTGSGLFVAASTAIVIPEGSGVAWTDFSFSSRGVPGLSLEPGDYLLGLNAGGATLSARTWVTPGPTNQIMTPSFEYEPDETEPAWFDIALTGDARLADVTTFETRSGWARFGARSALIETDATFPSDSAVGLLTPRVEVDEGEPFSARFSLNLTRGIQVSARIGVQFYDVDGDPLAYVEAVTGEVLTAPAVRDVTEPIGEVPAGATTATVSYLVHSELARDQTIVAYFDGLTAGVLDFRIYFDGDTPGYMWTGMQGDSLSSVGKSVAMPFVDAPLDDLGDVDGDPLPRVSIFGTYTIPYAVSTAVDDEYLSTLPFATAQAALGATQPIPGSDVQAACGWHGTLTDPERGSVAIVRTDGPLADLVGERIRITFEEEAVVAYVHTEADILDDLSVPRRSFMGLAPPAQESIDVTVEILAGI